MWRSFKSEQNGDETAEPIEVSIESRDEEDSEEKSQEEKESEDEDRQTRSASISSSASAPASHELRLHVPSNSHSSANSPTPSVGSAHSFSEKRGGTMADARQQKQQQRHQFQNLPSQFRSQLSAKTLSAQRTQAMSMFDPTARQNRDPPPRPDPTGVEYPRAASWAAGSCTNVLNDDKGRQLFRCFLFQSLAEENLSFIEATEKLRKMKGSQEKKEFAQEILNTYAPSINLSSIAMKKMKDTIESDDPNIEDFAPAIKEVRRLLENDQFPRFRRSEIYLNFLEELLPRAYAEKWTTSFEALLGNHVGRHYFRLFLRGIHAEENLRFWEAVVEFRSTKNKSNAMLNLGGVILQTYLSEGTLNEVFLPFGVRQVIERRVQDKEVDETLFDDAIKHVEQVLRNDPYVRFLQSPLYNNLLAKLKK